LKVLILNWKHPADPLAGGAEVYVTRLAAEWAAQGHSVDMLVPPVGKERLVGADPWPTGCRVLPLGDTRSSSRPTRRYRRTYTRIWSSLSFFRAVRGYLRAHGDDYDRVVESVSTRPFFADSIVGERAIILYHQGAGALWCEEFVPPASWIGRWLIEPHWVRQMRRARVVVVSPSTEADLVARQVPVEGVIAPGIDLPTEPVARRLGDPPHHIVFLGRLVTSKRPLEALAAFAQIRTALPTATLDVIGDGYLAENLRQQRAPGVTVHGFVAETRKAEMLARADLMLMPGTREGWGIVAMEAAALGTPVVGYKIAGVRDAILEGVTGVLTDPTPHALADAAVRLLADPDRWAQLSSAAAKRAREYAWRAVADRWLAVLEQRDAGESSVGLQPMSVGSRPS
jgi:glycosyltransferase involved in cell wall biosynthesis